MTVARRRVRARPLRRACPRAHHLHPGRAGRGNGGPHRRRQGTPRTLPEGTQSGTKFRLRGQGIQYLNGRGRGDQYVIVDVEIPKKLNRTQREALKAFEDSLKDENYEKRKSFFKNLKDRFMS